MLCFENNEKEYIKALFVVQNNSVNFVIGWVYELTGSADVAFYIGGSFIILAGLLIILIPVIDHFYNEEEKPTGKKPEKIQKECFNVYCM